MDSNSANGPGNLVGNPNIAEALKSAGVVGGTITAGTISGSTITAGTIAARLVDASRIPWGAPVMARQKLVGPSVPTDLLPPRGYKWWVDRFRGTGIEVVTDYDPVRHETRFDIVYTGMTYDQVHRLYSDMLLSQLGIGGPSPGLRLSPTNALVLLRMALGMMDQLMDPETELNINYRSRKRRVPSWR